jgi:hypothetical protein
MLTTLNPIHSDETKTKYYGEGLNGVLTTNSHARFMQVPI